MKWFRGVTKHERHSFSHDDIERIDGLLWEMAGLGQSERAHLACMILANLCEGRGHDSEHYALGWYQIDVTRKGS